MINQSRQSLFGGLPIQKLYFKLYIRILWVVGYALTLEGPAIGHKAGSHTPVVEGEDGRQSFE
jgi:hypothetical protein